VTAARLPAHLEVASLLRRAESRGGFGTVLAKGERDAGAILILTIERGRNACLWERMPSLDGSRKFTTTKSQTLENESEFSEYIGRRIARDPDSWVIELDIVDPERFIAEVAD